MEIIMCTYKQAAEGSRGSSRRLSSRTDNGNERVSRRSHSFSRRWAICMDGWADVVHAGVEQEWVLRAVCLIRAPRQDARQFCPAGESSRVESIRH